MPRMLSAAVLAAFGVVFKSDPTPPSLKEGDGVVPNRSRLQHECS